MKKQKDNLIDVERKSVQRANQAVKEQGKSFALVAKLQTMAKKDRRNFLIKKAEERRRMASLTAFFNWK